MRTSPALVPCLLAAGALTGLAPAASAATAPKCAVAKGAVLVLETPELLVTSGPQQKLKGGGRTLRTVSCRRSTGKRVRLFEDYTAPGASGGGTVVGVVDRRYVHVREFGGGAESEDVSMALVDTATGKRTADALIGGTDASGEAVVGRAGMLSATFGVGDGFVLLRRPGVGGVKVSDARVPGAEALALGARTAYYRVATAAGQPAIGTVAPSTARPLTVAGVTVKAAAPKASPRSFKGRCEGAGTTTVLRVRGARLIRDADGGTVLCSSAKGRGTQLGALVRGTTTTIDDASVTVLGGLDMATVRGRTADGRDVAAVLDLATRTVAHTAVAPAGSSFAVDRDGIAVVAPAGGAVSWVVGTSATVVAPASGTDADPAIAPRTDDGERTAVVHWRGADGTGQSWTAPAATTR